MEIKRIKQSKKEKALNKITEFFRVNDGSVNMYDYYDELNPFKTKQKKWVKHSISNIFDNRITVRVSCDIKDGLIFRDKLLYEYEIYYESAKIKIINNVLIQLLAIEQRKKK